MSQAFLIGGGNHKSREQKVQDIYTQNKPGQKLTSDPDTHLVTGETSIKIEDIRTLERILSLKPFNKPPKIGIIQEADKMTVEAQNALLKVLEEPPGETIFLLTTNEISSLLPTIISRCQVIYLPVENEINLSEEELKEIKTQVAKLMRTRIGKRLEIAERITTKEDAVLFCQKQLAFWRQMLLEKPTLERAKVVRTIQQTLKYLNANVNPKLAVENLVLSYPVI